MTRFAAAVWFAFGLCPLMPGPGLAQDTAPADSCFPWQEFRNGVCAAKSALPAPPPLPAVPAPSPPAPSPPPPSLAPPSLAPGPAERSCPASTHIDAASGNCVADAPPPPPPAPAPSRVLTTIACDGGTVVDGKCACPAGFGLALSTDDPARGGTCVRTDADNCLGGAMTVAGLCLCSGQVTMSGQVYELEYAKGKCVPKRCPRDGPCNATNAGDTGKPVAPKLSSDEPQRRHGCGRGMVATRSGCVPARQRRHTIEPGDYLPMYRAPGYANPLR